MKLAFHLVDPSSQINTLKAGGSRTKKGDTVIEIHGAARALDLSFDF